MDNELREYVIQKFNEPTRSPFMGYFLQACLLANQAEFEILRPAITAMQEKYPLKPQQLNEQEKP